MTRSAIVLVAAGLALAAADARAITKCVDAKGKVSYTDGKCPEDAKSNELKLQVAPPSVDPQAATKAPFDPAMDEKDDPRMEDFVITQAAFETCANLAPDFASRHGATFEAWRAARPELLAKLERSKRWKDSLESVRAQNKAQLAAPGGAQRMGAHCDSTLVQALAKAPAK